MVILAKTLKSTANAITALRARAAHRTLRNTIIGTTKQEQKSARATESMHIFWFKKGTIAASEALLLSEGRT